MRKSFLLMSFLAASIIITSLVYVKITEKNNHEEITLEKAFNSSGASLLSSEVYVWAKLGNELQNIEPLRPIIDEIVSGMNIIRDEKFSWNTMENDILLKTEVSGLTLEGSSISVVVQINKDQKDSGGRYISVNVVQDLTSDKIESSKNCIIEVFENHNIKSMTNSCITGTYEGKLDMIQLEDISKRVFSETEARKVEGVRDTNYISVSAYSPYIQESIQVRGKKVNLNLAARYNTYENKTYIWLATPVITTEY